MEGLIDASCSVGRTVIRSVREGSPRVEIVRYAREANMDLIVLSTHGRTGLFHVMLGSVAENVVRTAPCPVLALRPDGNQFVTPMNRGFVQIEVRRHVLPNRSGTVMARSEIPFHRRQIHAAFDQHISCSPEHDIRLRWHSVGPTTDGVNRSNGTNRPRPPKREVQAPRFSEEIRSQHRRRHRRCWRVCGICCNFPGSLFYDFKCLCRG